MFLKEKNSIGIVAPSFFIEKKKNFKQGIDYLQKQGFNVRFAPSVKKRFFSTTAPAEVRANEINKMFLDKEIKAIISLDGGCNAIEVLKHLDYDLIKKNPKVFSGFSDITHLLLAINSQTGIKTIHGMDIINGFGNITNPYHKENTDFFFKLLNTKLELNYPFQKKWKTFKKGEGKGIIVGGWLDALHNLAGTPYFPSYDKIILIWDSIDTELNKINMMLHSLKLKGMFERTVAMIIGSPVNCIEKEYYDCFYPFQKVILDVTKDYSFPIIFDADFGHSNKNLSFMIGEEAIVNTEEKVFKLLRKGGFYE